MGNYWLDYDDIVNKMAAEISAALEKKMNEVFPSFDPPIIDFTKFKGIVYGNVAQRQEAIHSK